MKTKLPNRILSLLLCVAMLSAMILPICRFPVDAAEEVSQWDNGSIVDYVHYTGEKNYLDDAPFGYAYFYQGTDPSDTRAAGFYDMILAVNGGNSWFKDRYYCGANDAETEYYNRTAAIHMAAVTYPTYHYSTGYVFTAPYTGTIEFTYQYAAVNASAAGMPFYVMGENATGYGDALKKLTTTKTVSVTDKAASSYDETTFTVEMTAGEKLYFVADSDASSKAFGHWISSVRYLPDTNDTWTKGNIVDYVHYTGEKNYLNDAPFGYAYFYQGTNPSDSRTAGFYDMILAVNGGDNWFKNRYYCGATDSETEYNARTAAIHLAAVTYPTYHYSTGYVFTAPQPGKVAFTYQYAAVNQSAVGMPFYVMRESATGYGDALQKFTAAKLANVNDKAASQYDEATFTVDVTAGEKIYFIADSDASNKAFGHWISSVRYLPTTTSVMTDQPSYKQGSSITVTSSLSNGSFGANDYIAIIPEGQTEPAAKKPAATSVTFTDTLPVGKYQVVLVLDSMSEYAASATIEIIENTVTLTHTPLFGVGSGQDGAICNGKVFYFSANGICKVHDLATGEYLNYFTLDNTGTIIPHANSVCFSNTYYEAGDAYPLLYANVYNNYSTAADRREGTCCVYRLTETDGHFSTELVQIIKIGFTEDLNLWKSKENNADVVPYGNFVVDTDNNDLYVFVMRDADQVTRFFRFPLPALSEGNYSNVYGCNVVTLEETDIESRFDVSYFSYMQGCCYADGKIFSVEGLGPDSGTKPALRVIDLESQGIIRTEMLEDYGLSGEPEMIDAYNGKLYFISTDRCFRELRLSGFTLPRSTSITTDPTWNVGDTITVTVTLSSGVFSANDYIAIIPNGESTPIAKKAAAESVIFTETLPAGKYQVVLVRDGIAGYAATADITVTERSSTTNWQNGNLTDRLGVHGEYLYHDSDSPFDYAFYYEGTDPNDTRSKGFYEMLLGFNGNTNTWCNYRYFCGLRTDEAISNNRTAAIHLAASTAPNYHYSPGMVFTAPHSGTVEFTYQYAGLDGLNSNHTFYVLRESAAGYDDALKSYKQSKIVKSVGGGEYSEDVFTVEVTAGEKIYFIVDNSGNGSMSAHWISSAKYLASSQLTVPDSAVYDRTATAVGMADGTLTITNTGTFPPESYVAYWADANGPLKDYTAFTSIAYQGKTTVYSLPSGSMIPAAADRILVYAKSGKVVSKQATAAMLPAGCNDYDFGTPLYEMQVVSDVHINASNPGKHSDHFSALLEQVKAISPNSIGLFINGDTADNGKLADWELFHSLIANAGDGLPAIYNAIGNHDLYSGDYTLFVEQTQPCADKPYADLWLKGTHFIFLGSEINDLNAQLSDEQLAWLEETLAKDRDMNRPIYLFLHQGLSDTVAGTEPTSGYHSVAQNNALCEILKDYPEVILFSSHSHRDMNVAPAYLQRSENLPAILNTAAVAYLRPDTDAYNADGSQAYFIYAYGDKLVVMGRDIVSNKWLASSTFCIDLSNVTVPTRTEIHSDKAMYAQGEEITVTATLKSGVFGTNDYVAILAKGESTPIAKQAAAPALSFTDALSPGEYLLVLKLDGQEGYAAQTVIRIAEAPNVSESSWDNGDLTSILGSGSKNFYGTDTPFSYAFFYEGTDPTDSREKGFHNMVLADNDVAWSDGRWFCGLTPSESANINRVNTIHTAASVAPSWHYSPGVCFTAPYTGTVQFIYQIAHLDTFANQHQIYVMREDAENYTDALKAYKPAATSIVSSSDGSGTYDTIRLTVDVTKGEKLYFIVDNRNNGSMTAHWIKSAQYLTVSDTVYSVYTDKQSYTVGDSITAYASVSKGIFGENDYIAILADGASSPVTKKVADDSVIFTEELDAGTYQVALFVDSIAEPVATQTIRIVEKVSAANGTWNNGNINSRVGAYGEYLYYDVDSPFGYAFFYEGTDPDDTRAAGFYDMILASNGGINPWCDNRYFCGLNASETENINRVVAIHLAAANAPNYHYSPGVVFTAPYSGTVEFTYQYAGLDDLSEDHTFYVMRQSAAGYGDAVKSFKQSQIIYTGGSGLYSEDTFTIDVSAGEKIYFVVDNAANGHMSAHWIKSAKYLVSGASYTLSADKQMYDEGEKITVAATISAGTFEESDYIAIVPNGKTEPALKLPASETVVIEPTAGQLPGGEYQIMLVLNGEDVYIDGKENCVASATILIRDTIDPNKSSWNYGTLLTRLGANGEKKYYPTSSPFGYAFFYEGTDPEDSRGQGFYDMILAKNGGKNKWCNNRYFCGLNASEYANINRTAAIHLAASNAPNYHYSPGLVFTAPHTGTVRIAYQFAGLDSIDPNHTFYVMRQSATGYHDALYTFKATKTVYSNGTGRTYNEELLTIDVTAGEKIYFVVDNAVNGGMSAHWISTVQYLDASGEPIGPLVSPNTGDPFALTVWLTALVCSAIGICTLTVVNVRSRKKKVQF